VRSGDQSGMYSIAYNNGTVVSKFLISAAPNFQLFYLMPVPDFYAASRPTVTVDEAPKEFQDSVFQMGTVINQNCRSLNVFTFPGSMTGISAAVELGSFPSESGPEGNALYCIAYDIVLIRTAGTTNATFAVLWTHDPINVDFSGDPLSLDLFANGHAVSIVSWQDDQNSGVNTVHLQGSHTNFGEGFDANDGLLQYIKICPLGTPPLPGSAWQFFIATQISPARNNQAASAPISMAGGYAFATDINYIFPLEVDIASQEMPLVVSLDPTTLPLQVLVENEEIDVNVVEPTPFHVIISNTTSEPIPVEVTVPVTVDGTVSITGDVAVIGTTDQTLPIWMTQYGPP